MIMAMVYKVRNSGWMIGWSEMRQVEQVTKEYNGVPVSIMQDKYEWIISSARRRFYQKEGMILELRWMEDEKP